MNNTGKNIKHLRTQKGLNQKELGIVLGVSQTSIAHYERGTREPNIETLKRLSNLFTISIDEITGNSVLHVKDKINDVLELNEELIEALLHKDDKTFIELFQNTIIGSFSIDFIIEEIIQKILYKVGDLWEKGLITEADEHYATNQIRRVISFISINNINIIKNKVALSMSVGSEKHTLGIEIINMYLESQGVKSIYLGSSVGFRSFEAFIREYKPDFINLSITLNQHLNHLIGLVEFLLERFKDKITIIIGGQGTKNLTPFPQSNIHIINDVESLKQFIK
jgi:methanogenic corrinoid protein MtbC1